ncbi:MAG: TonB-dependent receptor [Candidatus Omnitrophota bacterium]
MFKVKINFLNFILSLILLQTSNIFADEVFDLGQITVTATTTPHLLEKTPGTITVTTKDAIKKKNVQDVADIIESSAGVRVTRYGALGTDAPLSLRGLYSTHALVLIDGRPVNQPQLGSANLSQLSEDNVERIEIVRGPFSSLYGTGAIAGAVNIITKNPPEKFNTGIYGSSGTWNTSISGIEHGGRIKKLGYILNAENKTSDGDRDNSYYDAQDYVLKLEYPLEKGKISIKTGDNQGKLGSPGVKPSSNVRQRTLSQRIYGTDEVANTKDYQKNHDWYIDLGFKWDNWELKTYRNQWNLNWRGYYVVDMGFFAPDIRYHEENAKHNTDVYGASLQSNWKLTSFDNLTIGFAYLEDSYNYDYEDRDVTGGNLIQSSIDTSRNTQSVFFENEITLEPIILTFGGRYDKIRKYDSLFSPKINLLWNLTKKTRLRTSWGKAYRAPSLQDLYWPVDPYSQGNPNIRIEKSDSYEFGWEQEWQKKFISRITYFSQKVKDLIQWAPTGPRNQWNQPRWWPDNIGRIQMKGIEAELIVKLLNNLNLKLGWTHFLKAKQIRSEIIRTFDFATYLMQDNERDAIFVPKDKIDFGLYFKNIWPLKIDFNIDVQYVSSVKNYYIDWNRWDAPSGMIPTEEKRILGYTIANIKIVKKIKNLEFFLAINNLFDKDYATRFGLDLNDNDYPMPGRSINVGTKIEF